MKNTLLTSLLILAGLLPKAYSQTLYPKTTGVSPEHRFQPNKPIKPSGVIDSAYILLDYSSSDQVLYGASYISQQAQLINKYYKYPADTSNTHNTKNYDCITSATVAFDSLFAFNYNQGFSSYSVTNIWLDKIYVPIVQVNHSGQNDTLEIQLNTVDAAGYPTTNTMLDTVIIDSTNIDTNIGYNNDYKIKLITWHLHDYLLSGTKFAVTIIYSDASKLDSCWFIYGYGSFTKTCPYQKGITTFANPTHFSKVTESPSFIANSFVQWNEYTGLGLFPTKTADNVFYPCDSTDFVFHPGVDGATYLQNINITATAAMEFTVGIPTIHSTVINLSQNYPNPFNHTSTVTYSLVSAAEVGLKIVDLAGREVFDQNYGKINPGQHTLILDATKLSPGIYFYSITASGSTVTRKMVIY